MALTDTASCFADRSNLAKVYTRDDLATNQITAIRIGYRKRIASLAVARHEVAFEIHTPQLIGARDH